MPDPVLLNEFISTLRNNPIEFTDFSGKVRTFEVSGYLTVCYVIVAKELERGIDGYEYSATSYSSPHEAFTKVMDKVRTALTTRNLDPNDFPSLLNHRCAGRVTAGGIVVDGEFVPWESFTDLLQTYEGWEFSLKLGDE